LGDLPAEMVRPAARLHRHRAYLQPRREPQQRLSLQSPAQHDCPRLIQARQAAQVLAEINAKHENLHRSAPSLMDQTTGILPVPLGGGGPSHKLDSVVAVMQATDDRLGNDATKPLDWSADGRPPSHL